MLGTGGFPDEFYQTFKEEITTISCKLLQKVEKNNSKPILQGQKKTLTKMLPKLTKKIPRQHPSGIYTKKCLTKKLGKSDPAIYKKNYKP